MGKYQLDYKGMERVNQYHDKHSIHKPNKKLHVQELLKKARKKS